MAELPPVFNVCDALITCIVQDLNLWKNMTPVERIEEYQFFKNF